MAVSQHELETLLRDAFPKAAITVTDMSGTGSKYAAEIVDEAFRGQSRVAQHRQVYAALKGAMDGNDGALHALALTTRAPD